MALYACLTSLQLRALLSAADDRDSSTDAIQKATCSLHIAHIGVTRGESAARHRSKKSRFERGFFLLQRAGFHNQKEERKTPHFRFWYVHLIAKKRKEKKRKKKDPLVCFHLSSVRNKPARPDSSQCDQILLKGRQRGSRSSATCPAHAAVLPCVRGRTECAGDRRAEESGAHKGRARGGCDFSCLHPGARTVLCLHASVVMSSPSTLARRHVFGGGSGVCVGGIKKNK